MKKIIYSLAACMIAFLFTACGEETSQDTSKVTYFVNFEIQGDPIMQVPKGTPYIEPGVIATEGSNDISSSIETTGTVNTEKIGVYTIHYSAINVDGFSKSTKRTVIVYDPAVTTNLAGEYTTDEGSYRLWKADGAQKPFSGYKVVIKCAAPGVFQVSDFMGGYYDQGSAYGPGYAMSGYMKLNSDNTIEILSGFVPSWNDSYNAFENGKYDPATGKLHWEMTYGGDKMIFFVTLTK